MTWIPHTWDRDNPPEWRCDVCNGVDEHHDDCPELEDEADDDAEFEFDNMAGEFVDTEYD